MNKKLLWAFGGILLLFVALCVAAAPKTPSTPAPEQAATVVVTPAPAVVKHHSTKSQRQALGSAQGYIDLMGFSRAGLIDQLSSKAGDGYSRADATYAADHVKADWNAEAVEAAEQYLSISHFSRSGLIGQLHSAAGSGFTNKQATYAADKVGLTSGFTCADGSHSDAAHKQGACSQHGGVQ